MIYKKKILQLLGASCLLHNGYANSSWSFLDHYAQSESAPLVCGIQDYAWYEKSNSDSVTIPKVESETLFLEADALNGQYNQTHIAQGNVTAYKGNQSLFADWLIYDQAHDRVTAGDNISMVRQYDSVSGKWADYYMDLQTGTFKQATVYYSKDELTASGQQIDILDANHMNVSQGYFTGCDPNDPAWYIKSNQMTFDYQNSEGTARNPTMYFESIPIFTSPYMSFPLGQRKSGWLTPNIGGTNTSGFMVSDPFYWNMAPNYDMTITPYIWANQGFMVADEFRYKTESNVGSIYTQQVPYSWGDTTYGSYRYYWSLNDTYNPYNQLQMGYTYNSVSDNNYFNDFGNFYAVTDNVNLEQSIYAKYAPTWGMASVKLQNFQTLYPYGFNATVPIYSSYPAINFTVNPQDIGGGFKGAVTSQFTNFYSPAMQSGERSVLYPSVTYPLQSAWGFATPKLGYNYTYYNLGNIPGVVGGSGSQDVRALPIASLDSGLIFDRPLNLGSGNWTQTFEPRAYYLYIPVQNQANLPDFDTATATYNINQLFSENRFSGFDRINSANDITLGASSKIINDATGKEFMNLGLGYRYYVSEQNNFIYGNETQYSQLFLPTPNLIAELSNNWSRQVATTASFQYDTIYDTIDAYSLGLRLNPEDGKVVNVRYRYQYQLPLLYYAWTPGQQLLNAQYENQYALDISGQWPIYENKLYAVGRTNYDFTMQQLLNVLGGLEYNGGCYTISAVYEQFVFNVNQSQQNYMLNFSFKGIGGVGSGDPASDMKINVPGYMPINQLNPSIH